jgi:arsenate reductase (glutaredoxin)
MKVYGLPHCSTTKKALDYLIQQGHAAIIVDYREQPLSLKQLTQYFKQSGQPITAWLNTSGQAYRDQKESLQGQSSEVILQKMATEPMLIKRPLLVSDHLVLAGFKESIYQTL